MTARGQGPCPEEARTRALLARCGPAAEEARADEARADEAWAEEHWSACARCDALVEAHGRPLAHEVAALDALLERGDLGADLCPAGPDVLAPAPTWQVRAHLAWCARCGALRRAGRGAPLVLAAASCALDAEPDDRPGFSDLAPVEPGCRLLRAPERPGLLRLRRVDPSAEPVRGRRVRLRAVGHDPWEADVAEDGTFLLEPGDTARLVATVAAGAPLRVERLP